MSDTDYTQLLNRGVQLRIQAKTMEEEMKAMKAEANNLFTVALEISGEKKLTHERGTVTRTSSQRTSLNKEKLGTALTNRGVLATVVADSITEATEVKNITSITFKQKRTND